MGIKLTTRVFAVVISLWFCSCFDVVYEAPEELCHEAFVDCGSKGEPVFTGGRCRCECGEGAVIKNINSAFSIFQICSCSEEPCPFPGFKRVYNMDCECWPEGFNLSNKENEKHKNLKMESDYFPLAVGDYSIYQILDNFGMVNGYFGRINLDTLTVFLLDDSLQVAVHRTLYYQGIIAFDSVGLPVDTVLGPTLYNTPENSNFVGISFSQRKSLVGFHQLPDIDSIGNEIDGYAYFDPVGMVTVPGGTFDNCVFLNDHLGSGYVYAPDVGLIKMIAGGLDAMVLTEYNGENNNAECADMVNITEPVPDGTHIKASGHIIISSPIDDLAIVTLQAENYIQANAGFLVPAGAQVEFLIATCEQMSLLQERDHRNKENNQ